MLDVTAVALNGGLVLELGWDKMVAETNQESTKCCQCNYLLCSPKFDNILSFLLKKKVSIDQIFIYSKSWL